MRDKKNLAGDFLETWNLMHRYNLIWYVKNFGGIDPWQGQGRILSALRNKSTMSQKELGLYLDLRPQSLGEHLQKLESHGYIRRYRSTLDKRSLIVELTEKGEDFCLRRPDYDALFAALDATEKAALKTSLKKISAQLSEAIKTELEDYY